jgi:hypothetical protein
MNECTAAQGDREEQDSAAYFFAQRMSLRAWSAKCSLSITHTTYPHTIQDLTGSVAIAANSWVVTPTYSILSVITLTRLQVILQPIAIRSREAEDYNEDHDSDN